MANVKQTPTVVGKIIEGIRTSLRKLWYEKIAPPPPQPQRTQPVNLPIQAAATPETIHNLVALETVLTRGGDAQAVQTAFAALSQAERQAHWHTGETVPYAQQLAAWEQSMDELLALPQLGDGLRDDPQPWFADNVADQQDTHRFTPGLPLLGTPG